jgi:hypothetical protein
MLRIAVVLAAPLVGEESGTGFGAKSVHGEQTLAIASRPLSQAISSAYRGLPGSSTRVRQGALVRDPACPAG